MAVDPRAAARRRARRDRHGRGLRRPLAPAAVPLSESRRERFDRLVVDALGQLAPQWQERLPDLEIAVEDVPPVNDDELVVLAEVIAGDGRPALVVYRRPIEARAHDPEDLGDLVLEVVVDALAEHLGVDPDELDPPDE
jgi:predicted Zn-dependent protease with MMP-like domain